MSVNPKTDATAVPAGSWLVLTLVPSIAGRLDVFQGIQVAAGQWIDYAPNTWAIKGTPVVSTGFWSGSSVNVTIQVPADTTIAAIATVADGVSNQLDISAVALIGALPPTPEQETNPDDTGDDDPPCSGTGDWFNDPTGCLWKAIKGPAMLLLIVFVLYVLWKSGVLKSATKTVVAEVKDLSKPARKSKGKK